MTDPVRPVAPRIEIERIYRKAQSAALDWKLQSDESCDLIDDLLVACEAYLAAAPVPCASADRPRIICLCGSSRFIAEMAVFAWNLEKGGAIVLSLHLLPTWYVGVQNDHQAEAEGIAEAMDELHKRKIDLADEIFVMNVGDYIGSSTRSEIAYATEHGKPVRYLEETTATAFADALDPNAPWNRREQRVHTCDFQNRVREIQRPDICAECERQTHKDADGFVRATGE